MGSANISALIFIEMRGFIMRYKKPIPMSAAMKRNPAIEKLRRIMMNKNPITIILCQSFQRSKMDVFQFSIHSKSAMVAETEKYVGWLMQILLDV
jgi:hypothetical protein